MYSHTKHVFCGLDSFGVTGKCYVFTVSFVQTDRKTDRQTPVKQYAPDLTMRGRKKGIKSAKIQVRLTKIWPRRRYNGPQSIC